MPNSSYKCVNHPERQARSKHILLCSYCYKKKLLEENPIFAESQKRASKYFFQNNPMYRSEHYWKHKEKFPEKHSALREQQIHSNLLRKLERYGLTLEQYDVLLEKGCQVCGSKDRLHLDHNHDTGNFRGLLCGKCNTGVGMFDDDVERLQAMINYLNEHTKK